MKIKIWVLVPFVPGDMEPCVPELFASEQEAEAAADKWHRDEWRDHPPIDRETGEPMLYPADWWDANVAIREDTAAGKAPWPEYEISVYEIDLGSLAAIVQGGMVQGFVTTGPLAGSEIVTIDHDIDDGDPDAMIPQDGGKPAPAFVGRFEIEASPKWLPRAMKAINQAEEDSA